MPRAALLSACLVMLLLQLAGCRPDSPVGGSPTPLAVEPEESLAAVDATESVAPANPQLATGSGEIELEVENDVAEPDVPEPTPSEPVQAVMTLRPAPPSAEADFELLVFIRIARAHYLHAADEAAGPYLPLGFELTLPPGVEALAEWEFPPSEAGRGAARVYRNSVRLRRLLKVRPGLPPQTLAISGELKYQACNDELCWPAGKMELSASVVISPPQ